MRLDAAALARTHLRHTLFEPRAENVPRKIDRIQLVSWSLGTAVCAFLLAFVIYVLGDTVLQVVWPGLYKQDRVIFSIVGYQFLGLGVAMSAIWLVMHRTGARAGVLGFRFPGFTVLVRALMMLVPIFIGVALISAAFSTFLPAYHLQGNAKQELPVGNHVSMVRALLILVWAAVEAPLVEETLFRGIIFQGVTRFCHLRFNQSLSVFIGAVSSGIIFGLAHFEPHTLPILVFLGIALAYVFYYGRGIYASMLVHGVVNAIAAISIFHGA